ncbi:hypothetical protein [Serratia marcescens]|uniref:hypothetical protein n=2 Tax=Serratia marcescens TaxID=615 RepID=UPI00236301F5|nr:hypothetical protein [Serratia marcescens]
MAGGYWGKGNNPYWNYDTDAANSRQRANDAESEAQRAKLDTQQAQFDTSIANDRANRLQMQLNNTINSNRKVVADYEQRLEGFKQNFFKIMMQSNIFYRTLNKLQDDWPDRKEHILDEIQRQRDFCNQAEYHDKWWNAVSQNNIGDSVLEFPYPKRELKSKP